ncbi:YeeE/YedE family protein [Shimia biformata]|uniref:YeeE/YedE family protein n=1 Tax=Shimia biformata TaxID=1294299 RepID=UPI0019527CE4|nr:YeeE/YedE family protein [Shimia biformata]
MQRLILAFIAGGLFGSGLFVSGMTDTTKVQGWLDVFGNWDPTLAFVMGGAIIPMAIAWAFTKGRKPLVGGDFPAPPEPKLGRNLVVGSVLFGMGWGLAGLCPGPAVASLSYGGWPHWVFFAAMLAGMFAAPAVRARVDRAVPAE